MTDKPHDPWCGPPPGAPAGIAPTRPPQILTAIPVTLCLTPGHAARLILVAGPEATEADREFISRIVVKIDPAISARAVIERLAELAGDEDQEIRH